MLLAGGALLAIRLVRLQDRIDRLEEQVSALLADSGGTARGRSDAASALPPALLPDEPGRDRTGLTELPPPREAALAEAMPEAGEAESEPAWEPASAAPAEALSALFERLVGGRLLIWVGGIALAVAGIFLVRFSIEIGLVTPTVRMAAAALFGLLLVGAGEVSRSRPALLGDPRTAQALVGAGILVLYAAGYGSHALYGLISLGAASAAMTAVTGAALMLSLRHGAPTAVMGLIGGFVTPLLVGDPDSRAVPLLTYLALLDLALFTIAMRRGWTWLAAAAALLSFAWTAALLVAPRPDDALAAGAFVVGLSLAASLLRPLQGRWLRMLQPAVIGIVQLALLVARTDLGLAAWGLFGLLSLAGLILSIRDGAFRLLPPAALLLALLLLFGKAATSDDPLVPWVAAAITLLFGGFALARASGAGRMLWTAIGCAATVGPILILRVTTPALVVPAGWAALMLLLALAPGWLAWRHRGHAGEDPPDWALALAAAAAILLALVAASDLAPLRWLPSAWLLVAAAAAWCAGRVQDRGLILLAAAIAGLAVLRALPMVPQLWETLGGSLIGLPALASGLPSPMRAVQALLVPGALLVGIWRLLPPMGTGARRGIAGAAGLFLAAATYVLFKQLFGLRDAEDFIARGLAERTLLTQALFAAGWVAARSRAGSGRPAEAAAFLAAALTALAAARFLWFDLLLHNPAWSSQRVGPLPVVNLLLPACLGSAFWLYDARRRAAQAASPVWLMLFLAALVAGVMLMVRQLFHGSLLTGGSLPRAEFYGYSLAGLMLSVMLLIGGVRFSDRALRIAGLALLTGTVFKVFLVDAAALAGVLRILSFLGLGIALIGVGKLYAKVLAGEPRHGDDIAPEGRGRPGPRGGG